MKQIIFLIVIIANSLSLDGQCTEDKFCLSFANPAVVMGGSHFEVDLVVSSNSDFGLGTSNLQFRYNNAALATPIIISSSIQAPTYQTPSVTTPFIPSIGEMVGSFNLELNSQGTGINIPPAGMTVCRLRFNVTNPAMSSTLAWYYNGGTAQTVVFDHNESTQLCAIDPGTGCLQPSSSVLPLELVELKSTATRNSILVEWRTDNEQNSSHFDVQRSENGIDFMTINKTEAANDPSGAMYNYDDKEVVRGVTYYYRLKIEDLDGRYVYSQVISNRLQKEEIQFDVYPNPVSKNESIFIKVNKSLGYNFTLLDSKQRVILSNDFQENAEVSLESLDGGIYFYRIEYEGSIKSGKIVVQ